ncbi:MAG: glycosyltransferase family 4 protein [Candidatus Omnitrophica bacterium]|nr:glycosyltransferase family 4 protein [Candidatus Omnitrophota bacterium]
MRVLFLTQTDIDGPASRYRVYQYLDFLKEQGIEYTLSPGVSKGNYLKVYSGYHPLKKLAALVPVFFKRLIDVLRVSRYDIVFLQREIFPQIYPIIEKMIMKLNKNVVFDFDDAIFLVPAGRAGFIYKFRYKHNIREIIKGSSHIITGNVYLREYAGRFNPNVCVIPTCVDTDRFYIKKRLISDNEQAVIGWIGTEHSLIYLKSIEGVFKELSKNFNICLHVIGGRNFAVKGVKVVNKKWDMDTEVADLHELDIGVAPLLDDGWGKGKCGLKALQYMSCGIPVVCSDAGVYKEMIVEGENGFLASIANDWVQKLTMLIQDKKLREKISLAARNMIEEKYSLKVNAARLKTVFDFVLKGSSR